MSFNLRKTIFKTLKITGITIAALLLLLFTLPYLFPKTVSDKIKQFARGSITSQLDFSETRLSFFKHFPSLTLTLYDLSLKGSAPFQNDTLVAAKEVSFGIDLTSVFKSKITIDKIFLEDAFINIQGDTAGHVNYNVYKSKSSQPANAADTSSASLGIDEIIIKNSRLVYNDQSIPMTFNARGINYTGSGDLSKDVFDLHTHTEMASVDFIYNNQAYVLNKKVNADLVTSINTKSLAFEFQKNNLLINQFPVQFIGKFAFIKDGYDMDFEVNSKESNLRDMVTALPPEYLKWLSETDLGGKGDMQLKLAGKYIAKDSIMPDLSLNFKVRNGYVSYQKSPAAISNLFLNFETRLPGLDPDSLEVNVDSLYFNMGKDYFSSILRVHGARTPDIFAKVNTEIDLAKWSRASGFKSLDLKGHYGLHLLASGKFATAIVRTGMRRKRDTIITSIPQFSLKSSFSDGYIKYASMPLAVSNIAFNMNAVCPDHNYHHATFELAGLNANVLDNFVKGYLKCSAAPGFPVDAALKANFNLADIKKVYPVKGMTLSGKLLADLETKGKYIPGKRIFPHTEAHINLQNGSVQTKYYPHPIENIQVNTTISDNTGSMQGLKVAFNPVSFVFEGQPFMVKASLKNFDNLEYDIKSQGTLDIGKIYQVFAVKGYNVNGLIATNLSLKGKQSDAVAGNYAKLNNSGSMTVKDIALTSDLFPKPFLIKNGKFSFNQDKMNFDAFKATYGKSVIVLNGALSNVIGYATKPNDTLKGNFTFTSDGVIADDFMAFASTSPTATAKPSANAGVIMVPKNLNLTLAADLKKVKYEGLELDDAKGQMTIDNGSIVLKQTGFTLIGAPVSMDATYTSVDPKRATFDYHISAKNFDIKKAYNQIKLFHDMVTSAKSAEGLVSLDYKLSGRLNSNMAPVYPSLNGGGVLTLEKIRLKGFRLFSAVGSRTNHNGIDTGDVSKVNIETTVANNLITVKKTKIKMAGFRLKFDGQVSFDNQLNLHFRLGLPPLGILGIPMTITGTEAQPNIHLGNGKKGEELKPTADDDKDE